VFGFLPRSKVVFFRGSEFKVGGAIFFVGDVCEFVDANAVGEFFEVVVVDPVDVFFEDGVTVSFFFGRVVGARVVFFEFGEGVEVVGFFAGCVDIDSERDK